MEKKILSSKTAKYLIPLIVIIVIGLVIRIALMTGPSTSHDGARMTDLAYKFLIGDLDLVNEGTFGFRFFAYLPISLSIMLFGLNDFSIILPNLILSLATIVLAYKITHFIMPREEVALLSAFLIAIFPLEILFSTNLTLDVASSFFISMSLYSVLYISKGEMEDTPQQRMNLSYLLLGVFVGIAFEIREMSIMILPFLAVLFLYDLYKGTLTKKKVLLKYVIMAVGFTSMIGVELIYCFLLTGYPLLRYWFYFGFGWGPEGMAGSVDFGYVGIREGVTSLSIYPEVMIYPDLLVGYSFYILIFALVILFLKNSTLEDSSRKRIKLTLFWIAVILLYLQFGTWQPFEWTLFEKQTRFLLSISLPMWAIISVGIWILVDHSREISPSRHVKKMNKYLPILAILTLITISNMMFIMEARSAYMDGPSEDVYNYLDTQPILPTYVYSMVYALEYYFEYNHPSLIELENGIVIENNSYVVIEENRWTPGFPEDLEYLDMSNWTLLHTIVSSRVSPFPKGKSYNYSTYIYYV
ncbi:MAG: glycosyltransferase family 39 protein [Candidatus Thorarchaeota archaeon]